MSAWSDTCLYKHTLCARAVICLPAEQTARCKQAGVNDRNHVNAKDKMQEHAASNNSDKVNVRRLD
jgi:hypothetical protein